MKIIVELHQNIILSRTIVGPKHKFRICHSWLLIIRRISDFVKIVGFRRNRIRNRNPSHP